MPRISAITYLISLAVPIIIACGIGRRQVINEKIKKGNNHPEDTQFPVSGSTKNDEIDPDVEKAYLVHQQKFVNFQSLEDSKREWNLSLIKRYDTMQPSEKRKFITFLLDSRFPETGKKVLIQNNNDPISDSLRDHHVLFISTTPPLPDSLESDMRNAYLLRNLKDKSVGFAGNNHVLEFKSTMDIFIASILQ